MCETHEMKKEKNLQNERDPGSNQEYEDCRSLQERGLPALNGLYREDDWDSRHQTAGGRVNYRKRPCGYWDFEQEVNQVMWTTRKQRKVERTVCTTEV